MNKIQKTFVLETIKALKEGKASIAKKNYTHAIEWWEVDTLISELESPLMNKSREIEMLEELRDSNSYLKNTLKEDGINKMIQNITNDHPIDLKVFITAGKVRDSIAYEREQGKKRETSLSEALVVEREKRFASESKFSEFAEFVLKNVLGHDHLKDQDIDHFIRSIIQRFTPKQIALSKILQDIPLNEDERGWTQSLFIESMNLKKDQTAFTPELR